VDIDDKHWKPLFKKDPYRAGAALAFDVPFDEVPIPLRDRFKTAFLCAFQAHGITVLQNTLEFLDDMAEILQRRGMLDEISAAADQLSRGRQDGAKE